MDPLPDPRLSSELGKQSLEIGGLHRCASHCAEESCRGTETELFASLDPRSDHLAGAGVDSDDSAPLAFAMKNGDRARFEIDVLLEQRQRLRMA